MKERLIFGLIAIVGLILMLVGGTMHTSFISGTMFIVGLLTFGTFTVWAIEEPSRITIRQCFEEDQKFLK